MALSPLTRVAGVLAASALCLACAGLGSDGPFSGDAGLELVLEGSAATADIDAPVLEARFTEVGVSAEAEVRGPDQVALRLSGIDVTLDRSALLARSVLSLTFPNGEVLSNDAVADAHTRLEERMGRPQVWVALTPSGAERFCTLSGESVGQVVSIALDGTVQSDPVIREAICGGRLVIDMGAAQSFDEAVRQAEALAATLRTAPLASKWIVVSEHLVTR